MRLTLIVCAALFLFGCSDVEDKSNSVTGIACTDGDDCPEGTRCSDGSGSQYRCLLECNGGQDCDDGQSCVATSEGFRVCDEPRPVCDGDASQADCECGFRAGSAFVVSGTGEDCTIVEREADACYGQWATCLNACVTEFYRYDLGDGTALIVQGLQGGITEGWTSEGQGAFPMSCPALDGEFMLEF